MNISSLFPKVYLSTRTGAYVIHRLGPGGYPIDYKLFRRYLVTWLDKMPIQICNWYFEKFYIEPRFNHKLYNVPPKYHVLSKDPVVSDHICSKLLSGSVVQKKRIERLTENGVIFEGSNEETEIDSIIMATGYTWNFPFLEDGIVKQEKNGRINLYKVMYPPQLKHPTLAIIGFLLPYGALFPLAEIQCRWAAHIFAGKGHLPSSRKMLKDIKKQFEANEKRFCSSDKMTLRVDYLQYLDDIASQFGVNPNFAKLFFTDIKLFWKLIWGPSVPYQYRLRGPHKWNGARDAILTCKKRLKAPLIPDKYEKKNSQQ
ncbi:flavin-containing monooxygenase 5-like [Stegodyphus dumicola]|uniref:flavin-containing monooxygenase 5-like n=1 Tax=Stegodyphus dumicola TaxID=202533 RepID=UPI0015AB3A74|nr:flavin-containing monooxygenase 5-like [Stegodyphus dumicola]